MKKKLLLIAVLLFVFPIFASAAAKPAVVELKTKVSGNTIKFNGEMEDGSYAVMCKLLDKDDNEIDLLSTEVDENKFEGQFTKVNKGNYTVSCANYEGGELKNVDVKVIQTFNNPVTYDAGITSSVISLSVSLVGLLGATVYLKLKKKSKNN